MNKIIMEKKRPLILDSEFGFKEKTIKLEKKIFN